MFKRRSRSSSQTAKKSAPYQPVALENTAATAPLSHLHHDQHLANDDSSPLGNFDACIEACDALAASSSNLDLFDCSMLVSPDGMLLDRNFHERGLGYRGNVEASSGASGKKDSSNASLQALAKDDIRNQNGVDDIEKEEDYHSAIYIGNDLSLRGDEEYNGFSARGWNPIMASMALQRSLKTMEATEGFVEELILSKKNSAASASQACAQLRDIMMIQKATPLHPQYHRSNSNDSTTDGKIEADSAAINKLTSMQKSSAGPLLFPGTTLRKAMMALDKYHSSVAEAEAHRWRAATKSSSEQGHGVLPEFQKNVLRAKERIEKIEKAMMASQERQAEAESYLRAQKDHSRKLWLKVEAVEEEISKKVAELVRKRSTEREIKRRQEVTQREAAFSDVKLESTVTNQEIWELVANVGEDGEDFAPSGLPTPTFHGPIDQTLSKSKSFDPDTPEKDDSRHSAQIAAEIDAYRAALEFDLGLDQLRKAALNADEQVQDAAGTLLNVYSAADTTKRSAKIACEASLLSTANAQVKCLKSLVQLEKDSIYERLRLIEHLEKAVNDVDVRSDLNTFIEHEKSEIPNGTSKLGDNDDGGVASALAVLNAHSEGIGVGIGVAGMAELSSFSERNDNDEDKIYDRESLEKAVGVLFNPNFSDEESKTIFDGSVELLSKAVGEKTVRARGYRASTCYAMNNFRGKVSQLKNEEQLDGLCKVLQSLLDGCDREPADVANAKMVMMLAQTFYFLDSDSQHSEDRSNRIYPKDKLCSHPIWLDEDFWVQALFQCVTDSLSNSGVIMRVRVKKSVATKGNKMKWHDLRPIDRADAAAQVHAVIFSQLGALAHSMVEFGCSVKKACQFVRRLSVRHQLPLSQRAMLLNHLMKNETNTEQ